MLKINPDPTFTADVDITVPGKNETAKLSLTFKYLSKTAVKDFWENNKDKKDSDALTNIVVGWSGIDAEFTAENFDKFLDNYPAASFEILSSYQALLLESKAKN